jgi:protein phosphatase PTC7
MELATRKVALNMLPSKASRRYVQASYNTRVFGALSASSTRSLTTSSTTHNPLISSQQWAPTPIHLRAFHTSPTSSSKPNYTYGIAASFSAKDHRFDATRNVVSFLPRPIRSKPRRAKSKRPGSGQDAFFISQLGSSNDVALGVADGVGGWVDSGVDPADFAHAFCEYMEFTAAKHEPAADHGPLSAKRLMQAGYDDVVADETIKAGGSTACVAIAKADGSLEVANLGDSGFLQLRLNAVHHYSEPQTHAFNTPYQLAIIPEAMRARTAAFGGMQLCDMPKDSAVSKHDVRHGDVLVFASDGVLDNLSSSDILRIVSKLMVGARAWVHTDEGIRVTDHLGEFIRKDKATEGPINSLQSFLAVGIASEAKAASLNTKVDGPFAKEVQKYYPEEMWRGGKVDDICVITAVVVEEGK